MNTNNKSVTRHINFGLRFHNDYAKVLHIWYTFHTKIIQLLCDMSSNDPYMPWFYTFGIRFHNLIL